MVLTNKFMFRGVGQGLFYVGHIDNGMFNFVYDCGIWDSLHKNESEKRKEEIERKIINQEYKDVKFDFITISHLHEDHVNLLPEMLKKLKNTGKIYFPYFPKDKINVLKAYLVINNIKPDLSDGSLYQIFVQFYNRQTRIVLGDGTIINIDNVIFVGGDEQNDFPYRQEIYQQDITKDKKIIDIWYFKFFNKHINDEIIQKLEYEISKILKKYGEKTLEDYLKVDTANRIKKIKEQFEKYNCANNITSLLLLHHPPMGPETLLSGDAEFDLDLEKRVLQELTDNKYQDTNKYQELAIFQVPHHGSKKNWEKISGDWKYKPNKLIFSFGLSNRFGHPSPIFYNELKQKRLNLNQLCLVFYDESLSEHECEHYFMYCIDKNKCYYCLDNDEDCSICLVSSLNRNSPKLVNKHHSPSSLL